MQCILVTTFLWYFLDQSQISLTYKTKVNYNFIYMIHLFFHCRTETFSHKIRNVPVCSFMACVASAPLALQHLLDMEVSVLGAQGTPDVSEPTDDCKVLLSQTFPRRDRLGTTWKRQGAASSKEMPSPTTNLIQV